MRPLSLRVENFTCFRGAQPVLDFAGLELFAIAGPTGAGKTSLLDAMLFALYGTVPRLPRAKSAADLIALGRDRMSVVLDFSIGGQTYRVARSVRRRTGIVSEAQLEELSDDGESHPVADGVTAVNAALASRLALSYDAFAQAVVLPQGEFARFLKSAPRERQEILRDLLRLGVFERMRQHADADARAAEAAARTISELLESVLAGATPQAVSELERRFAAVQAAAKRTRPALEKQAATLERLRARVETARQLTSARVRLNGLLARAATVEADARRLEAARGAAGVLPRVEAGEAAAAESERAGQASARTERAAKTAHEAEAAAGARLAAADREAEALPELARQLERLAQAEALLPPLGGAEQDARQATQRADERAREADAARRAIPPAESAVKLALRSEEQAAVRAAKATDALTAATASVSVAREALRTAERRHAVAHLRHGLARGDACPVCEQPLSRAPKRAQAVKLADLERALLEAERDEAAVRLALETAREAAEQARRARERAEADAEARRQQSTVTQKASREASADAKAARDRRDALAQRLAALSTDSDPRAAAARLRVQQSALAAALEQARKAGAACANARAAAVAEDAAAREAAKAADARSKQALEAARAAARRAGFDGPEAVRRAALAPEALASLDESINAYGRERHSAEASVAALEQELGGEAPTEDELARAEQRWSELSSEREAQVREEAALEQQLASARARLEQAEARRAELEEQRARHGTLRQLSLDLQAGGFQAWLLEETFAELVAGASQRLLELSGRYGLMHEDKFFFVVDHENGGERRRAETLSGGETFLASLALALELSQQVQRAAGAVPLQSLFIDEGFGSLDAETLDAVTGAIESLPRSGRMVGVVTHIKELTDRLPARIRVSRRGGGSEARVEWS